MSVGVPVNPATVTTSIVVDEYRGWHRAVRFGLPAVAVALAALMWSGLEREAIGAVGILMMLTLMLMKVPLGAALGVPGLLGTFAIVGDRATEGMLGRMAFEVTASWSLTVIPMFVLMGLVLFRSGITADLFVVARQWVGWVPGGLGVGTNMAGAGFASLSGSTLGSIFPLSRAGIPEMIKAGYDRRLAVASVMSAGTLAHLIPPSLFLVVYAGVASVPVGPQLLAGLVPGLVLAGLYMVTIIVVSVLRPSLAGGNTAKVSATWPERLLGIRRIIPAPILLVVVVGGLYSGWFTATEAGAVGALGAIAILFLRRRSAAPREMARAAADTAITVGAVFFLLIGATMLSRLLSVSGLADMFVRWIRDMDMSRVEFLLMMIVVYLLLGMVMEPLAMMLITVPILLPVMTSLDISPIWFGVFVVVFMELAVITPPVGILSFVVHGIVQDPEVNAGQRISLKDVFTAALALIPVPLVLVALMILFPELVMWLPNRM